MRFDVHKAVVAQSPFFRLLLENTHRLTTVDTNASTDHPMDSQKTSNDVLHLTIDLIEAMTRHGFIMTPSQYIIRRQWQRQAAPLNETPLVSSSSSEHKNDDSSLQTRHILGSHLRFALKWMYSMDRGSMVETLHDEDTLRVLCVAVLFGLDPLVNDCLERYTTQQLSINTITDDLETICQLPRDHKAYHHLRDAALLLLFRLGPQYPRHLARLPVDYMSDVLSVDLLYIGCEYERYCLLREVLVAYMQSVGKITWTSTGPVDQDFKRLSGFVRNPLLTQQEKQQGHNLSASDVRLSSRKRKRIPSQELLHIGCAEQQDSGDGSSGGDISTTNHQRLSRLSFSACVPFEKLVADASSGGVIDKATILSYLLRTTVNYSNMTFDQLAIVRQDVIVDESIVFRALWQREELERIYSHSIISKVSKFLRLWALQRRHLLEKQHSILLYHALEKWATTARVVPRMSWIEGLHWTNTLMWMTRMAKENDDECYWAHHNSDSVLRFLLSYQVRMIMMLIGTWWNLRATLKSKRPQHQLQK
ncbi:unnamed protein product [Absidia cylindrospora]